MLRLIDLIKCRLALPVDTFWRTRNGGLQRKLLFSTKAHPMRIRLANKNRVCTSTVYIYNVCLKLTTLLIHLIKKYIQSRYIFSHQQHYCPSCFCLSGRINIPTASPLILPPLLNHPISQMIISLLGCEIAYLNHQNYVKGH